MENEIVWTAEAKRTLLEIFDKLTTNDPLVAGSVVNGIFQKVQLLLTSPEIGWKYENMPNRDVRILLYGRYRITYNIHETGYIVLLGVFPISNNLEQKRF